MSWGALRKEGDISGSSVSIQITCYYTFHESSSVLVSSVTPIDCFSKLTTCINRNAT